MKFTATIIVSCLVGAHQILGAAIPDAAAAASLRVLQPPPMFVADDDVQQEMILNEDTNSTLSKRNTWTGYTTGAALQKQMLAYHNAYRAHHGSSNVTWSSSLAQVALKQAQKCVFAHSNPYKYGENLGGGSSGYNNPAYFVYLWYNEITQYNFSNPGYDDDTGHFTQVVWAASKQIGCAWVVGCSGDTQPVTPSMLLCEYYPNGNILPDSNFATNVKKPKSTPRLPATPPAST